MKTVAEVIGVSRSNLVERLQQRPPEADWSAAIAGRGAGGTDQGGDRRIADLRLPARSRHPQALDAGRGFKAAKSQARLSRDEGP